MSFPEVGTARVALTGAVLLAVTLALLPPFWLVVKRVFPGRNVFFARWGFVDVAKVLLAGLVAVFAARYIGGAIEGELLRALVLSTFVFASMGAACAAVAVRSEPTGVSALGFEEGKLGGAVLAALVLYVATLPGVVGLSLIAPWAVELGGGTFEPQPMLAQFLELKGTHLWVVAALMVLVIPFLEELLFRGFLQPLLVQNLREPGGIAMTSLIFAWLHDSSMFLPVFGLSLVLGTIKLRTQRLVASWFVHALHNGLVLWLYTSSEEIRAALHN